MPSLPPRGAVVPPFYAGLIAREAAELARAGRAIIPMHFGQPSAGAPPAALAAAAAALAAGPAGYVELPELRLRIARHYLDSYGVTVAPERILLAAGASAALVAAFTALTRPGDRIAIGRPGYPAYRNALTALGRVPVEVDCGAEAGFRLSAELLERSAAPLHAVVVASPANPTGAMLDAAALAGLAAWCRDHGARFISDEIYHGISYGAPTVTALAVDAEAIVINSFSKLYRMPGWRLGWMVLPATLAEHVAPHLINLLLTPPTLAQHAALAAFDDAAELAGAVEVYRRNRDYLLAALAALGLDRVAPPDGAFYLYVDVGHLTDDSLAFCRELLAATGIAAAPGIDFDTAHGRRFVRLSFAVSEAEARRAIALLGPWLASRQRR